ncbi:ABC transporter permease [Microbacterium sp. NIBRBAC000506063]|uniref:ABC transporter permease n=1 Tax=Microbacterium sp. NIBRBAC000506063 TaxID=2734618 RepID=UPI001BB62040|nr:ABC transporter permease [Microbacterium sp. NIBRBAC000506063]QTV80557.1 ABC transporter permease [Microbacterium sp. NIBRBAC000506063]
MTTVDRSEFSTPGRGRGVLDVFSRRYLLKLLVLKGTVLRYRNSVLGWTWSYVRPTVQFLVYYLIIGEVLGLARRVDMFPLYMLSGIVVVNLFNEAFGNATSSIVANKALVKKIYLPRELFPIAAVIGSLIHFLPQLVVLLVVSLLYGWIPSFASLGMVLAALALVLTFTTGVGLWFSAMNVRFRDAQNFVEIVRLVATWASPIIYPWTMVAERLPDWALWIYMSNPITVAVELFHQSFWGPVVDKAALDESLPLIVEGANHGFVDNFGIFIAIAWCIAIFMLLLGQWTFRSFERTFAQDL